MTDDRRFWDAVWYIADMPDPAVLRPGRFPEYRIIQEARRLMAKRAAELREREDRHADTA